MRTLTALVLLVFAGKAAAQQHELVHAKDGSGVFGYKDTPVQPWSGFHVHDPDRPVPKKVEPAPANGLEQAGAAPSDAIVLFDGKDLAQWQPNKWKIEDGCLIATEGPLATKQEFGDCQLHLEFQVPAEPDPNIWNRGNNGVMLLGEIEVQIFDSFDTKIYPDGQAAAIYAQTPPLVNACRKPGEWQTYDIFFQARSFDDAGETDRSGAADHAAQRRARPSQPGDLRPLAPCRPGQLRAVEEPRLRWPSALTTARSGFATSGSATWDRTTRNSRVVAVRRSGPRLA